MDQRDHEVRCMRLGLAVSRTWWPKTCPSSWTVMEHHAATKKLRHKFVPGEGKGCVPCLGFRALWESFLWRRCVFWMAVHAFSLGCSDAHLPNDSHHKDPNLNLHFPRASILGLLNIPMLSHVSRGSCGSISRWFFSMSKSWVPRTTFCWTLLRLVPSIHSSMVIRGLGEVFIGPWGLGWEFPILKHVSCRHPGGDEESASWVAKAGKILLMEDILHHPGSIKSGK